VNRRRDGKGRGRDGRTRKYLDVLIRAGLLEAQISGDGTNYVMTPRAYDFLRAYALVNSLVVLKA